jgi:integrase
MSSAISESGLCLDGSAALLSFFFPGREVGRKETSSCSISSTDLRNARSVALPTNEGCGEIPKSARQRVTGKAIADEKAVWQVVLKYVRATALGKLSPHDLRRTCSKLCRKAGGDLEQIQLLLGHASIQTTERYLERNRTWPQR